MVGLPAAATPRFGFQRRAVIAGKSRAFRTRPGPIFDKRLRPPVANYRRRNRHEA
jgi:hypothetical protein